MALKETTLACSLAIISGKRNVGLLQEPKHADLSLHVDRNPLLSSGTNRKAGGIFRSEQRSRGMYKLETAQSTLTANRTISGN